MKNTALVCVLEVAFSFGTVRILRFEDFLEKDAPKNTQVAESLRFPQWFLKYQANRASIENACDKNLEAMRSAALKIWEFKSQPMYVHFRPEPVLRFRNIRTWKDRGEK